jgi:hypothetical protein
MRYLSEGEVEAAYRDRFRAAGAQAIRSDEVERDVLARLATDSPPWVVVSLVPDLPGNLVVDSRTPDIGLGGQRRSGR